MRFRFIFLTNILVMFLSIMSAPSFATTLLFHEYSGGIGSQTIFANSDGTTYTYESFETMNGTPFTADDIDPVRSSIISTNDPSYQVTIYRGIRTFGADISTVTFNDNAFSFQAAPNPDCGEGVEFLLGSLSFTNGWWGADPIPPSFTFTISASSTNFQDGALQEFNGTIRLVGKADDSGDPVKNADWFYIQESPELGSVGVFEGETGTIEIYGKFGSLDLVEFKNPTDQTLTSDSLPYDSAPIPEPATVLLFGLGLLGVAGVSRRKN